MDSYQNFNNEEDSNIEGAAKIEVSIGSDILETHGHVRGIREARDSDFPAVEGQEHNRQEHNRQAREENHTQYQVNASCPIVIYNCVVCIYGSCIFFMSAILHGEYSSYKYLGPNKTESIDIDDLPGHLYQTTSTTAWWLFTSFILGFAVILKGIVDLCAKQRNKFIDSVGLANMLITFGTFYYVLYVTIKLHRLTEMEIQLWNSIDHMFIDIMRLCEILMYIVGFPAIVWSICMLAMLCIGIINAIRKFVCCIP